MITRMVYRGGASIAIAVASFGWHAEAVAQSAAGQGVQAVEHEQQARSGAGAGIDDIVVTARRRAEREQSTPVAITALSGQALSDRGIARTDQLQFYVPSFATTSFNRDAINNATIRGLPGVAGYVAEAPVTFSAFTNGFGLSSNALYTDLQSVQILKGPQGTLFGQNSIGGAILYSPQRPTNEFEGYGKIKVGSYSHREFEGAINIPIVDDQLAMRLAANVGKRNGFTKDIVRGVDHDDLNYAYFRGSLSWTPSDGFENHLYADYYRSKNNGAGYILQEVVPGSLSTVLYGQSTLDALLAEQNELGPRKTNATYNSYGLDPVRKQINYKIINTTTFEFTEGWQTKNIFSYQRFSELERDSLDGLPFSLVRFVTPDGTWNVDKKRITNELQQSAELFNGKLSLIVGGFYSRVSPSSSDRALFCFACDTPVGAISLFSNNQQYDTTYSLFTHGILDLSGINPGLKFAAGYRYNWDKTHAVNTGFFQLEPGGPEICGNGLPDCREDLRGKWKAEGWEFNLSQQFSRETMIYARAGRAYTRGGFNTNVTIAAAAPGASPTPAQIAEFQSVLDGFRSYDPETYTDIEFGLKADWRLLERPIRTNLALFRGWFDGIQRIVGVPTPAGIQIVNALGRAQGNYFPVTNAAKASVKGGELSIDYIPFDGLQLSGGASYVKASYTSWPFLGSDIADFNEFTAFPKWRANGRIGYTLPLDDSIGAITLAGDVLYTGSKLFSVAVNTAPTAVDPILRDSGYTLFNLRADWKGVMGSNFDIAAYVQNITDVDYRIGAADARAAYGLVQTLYGEPRMGFVEVRYHF